MHKLCIVCGNVASAQFDGSDYCQDHITDFVKAMSIQRNPGVDVDEVIKSIIYYKDDKLSK